MTLLHGLCRSTCHTSSTWCTLVKPVFPKSKHPFIMETTFSAGDPPDWPFTSDSPWDLLVLPGAPPEFPFQLGTLRQICFSLFALRQICWSPGAPPDLHVTPLLNSGSLKDRLESKFFPVGPSGLSTSACIKGSRSCLASVITLSSARHVSRAVCFVYHVRFPRE